MMTWDLAAFIPDEIAQVQRLYPQNLEQSQKVKLKLKLKGDLRGSGGAQTATEIVNLIQLR